MRCNIIQKIDHVIYLFGHWMTCIHKASSGKESFYLEPKSRLALTNYDKESSSIISSLRYIACQNALEIVQRINFTQRERKPGKFQGFWYKHDINTRPRRHAPKSITLKLRPSTFGSKMYISQKPFWLLAIQWGISNIGEQFSRFKFKSNVTKRIKVRALQIYIFFCGPKNSSEIEHKLWLISNLTFHPCHSAHLNSIHSLSKELFF